MFLRKPRIGQPRSPLFTSAVSPTKEDGNHKNDANREDEQDEHEEASCW